MLDFHDIRFPLALAFGASGGPVRPTDILQLSGGSEVRNAKTRYSRRRYNAVAGLKSKAEAIELMQFFEARYGPLYGFRFRDPLDHATGEPITPLDETLGFGDGDRTVFQLLRRYGDSVNSQLRPITKPVSGTVRAAVDGVEIAVTADHATGRITFAEPPSAGAIITAGFAFDIPVRFASDALDIVLDDFGATQIQDVPLIEILPHVEIDDA